MGDYLALLTASFAAAIINIIISVYGWRQNNPLGRLFALVSLSQACYAIGYALENLSTSLQGKVFWDDFQWYPSLTATTVFLWFVMTYTHINPRLIRRVRWITLASVGLLALATLTADWHGNLRLNPVLTNSGGLTTLNYEYGTFAYLIFLYSYGITWIALILLLIRLVRSSGIYRTQLTFMVIGVAIQIGGAMLAVAGVQIFNQRDFSPLTFPLGAFFISLALFRYRLFNVIPIARGAVFENITDPVIVLGEEGRVADMNAAALKLVGKPADDLIGKPFENLLRPEWQPTAEQYANIGDQSLETEITLPLNGTSHYFALTTSPLMDEKSAMRGRLIVLRDITPRKEAEAQIRKRSEELDLARREAEHLFAVSREVNRAQSYAEIVTAIAGHYADAMANIALSVFDQFNLNNAQTFEVVAVRPAGSPIVLTPALRFSADLVRSWLAGGVFVVHDMQTDARIDEGSRAYYQQHDTGAMMLTGLALGDRVIGMLNITSNAAHLYTDSEIRFMRAITDIVAAAVDRIHLYQEQVQTAERLREVDRLKSQFLASMSHELRTPLNSVLNFTEFVSIGMLGPVNERQTDALNKAIGSGKHLLALINDVLDITKIESGMMRLFVDEHIDLAVELQQVVAATQPMLAEKPVALVTEIAPNLPKVTGDKRRIRQIAFNLLSNACKFTESGSVTLQVMCKDDQQVLIKVSDTGPGITAEEQKVIFEPFRQGEHGVQHAAGGTGLGLAITKRLVEAHGGLIWVESELGAGATFFVTLPVRNEALLQPEHVP